MLTDVQILVLTVLSIGGALFAAILGWDDSGEPFDARKFSSSILRAFLAGALTAGSTFAGLDSIVNGWVYLFAFIGGAGIDVIGNRVAGAIAARTKSTTTTTVSSTKTTTNP